MTAFATRLKRSGLRRRNDSSGLLQRSSEHWWSSAHLTRSLKNFHDTLVSTSFIRHTLTLHKFHGCDRWTIGHYPSLNHMQCWVRKNVGNVDRRSEAVSPVQSRNLCWTPSRQYRFDGRDCFLLLQTKWLHSNRGGWKFSKSLFVEHFFEVKPVFL